MGDRSRIDRSRLQRITVLFEDDFILVVAKPSGMAVHGGAGKERLTLIDIVRAAYPVGNAVELAHRLDKGTSGVLVLAKTGAVARALMDAWPDVKKTYVAVALGRWRSGEERIEVPLEDRRGEVRTAITRVRLVAALESLGPPSALLEIRLETGRTHQIRQHLAQRGQPVLLDDRYGDFGRNRAFADAAKKAGLRVPKKGNLMLHALELNVTLAEHGGPLRFRAPLPETWPPLLSAAGAPGEAVDALSQVL